MHAMAAAVIGSGALLLAVGGTGALRQGSALAQDKAWGGPADIAFARSLWMQLEKDRLVGPRRINSAVLVGREPHGLQQVLASTARVAGRSGRVIVKMSYAGPAGLTQDQVWNAPDATLAAYTVMFKREAGYDTRHRDWFWVEFEPGGAVRKADGRALAGRVGTAVNDATCIGCHVKKGGRDLEVFTPQ